MSTMSAVVVAQRELTRALAEAEQQRREDAQAKLEALRREGAALRAQFEPMAAQIKAAENDRLRLASMLMAAKRQIESYSTQLDPLTLPSDQDIAEHARQLELWRHEQKRLLALANDAKERESIRPAAMKIQRRLENLRFEMNNLTAVAEGRRPGEVEGGLFRVGVDDRPF